jgi:hypothetical protein
LPESEAEQAWSSVTSYPVQLFPLWWRNDADPGLRVQAVHDGSTLVVRLAWKDATANQSALRPEDFEDMAAVEFCHAGQEPFLGMGSVDVPIDLWHWRASPQDRVTHNTMEVMDDYPFDSEEYRRLEQGPTKSDFVTARVVGNPLTKRRGDAATLAAQGPGSTTFRPPASQVVDTASTWHEGSWVILLRRSLSVAPTDGISLAPNQAYGVAFAVWNGEARDRASQKVISIWNDLQLE